MYTALVKNLMTLSSKEASEKMSLRLNARQTPSSSLSSISSDSSPDLSQVLRYAESDLDGEEPS